MAEHVKKNYLIDMDGVLVSGRNLIPGAREFIQALRENDRGYLILTNNSIYTPPDLSHRLQMLGLDIACERIFTSAMATARFLDSQHPQGKAFVIGEAGLTDALYSIGYVTTDTEPDYVVLGETLSYNMVSITKAVQLVSGGARFIATNPDPTGPSESGIVPATGALAALIEKATGVSPMFIGKPNPFMMRAALNFLGAHTEDTVMIGDRMETDIISGVESGLETILVLTGIASLDDLHRYPYRPSRIVQSLSEIEIKGSAA
jgi:NagD protein